ncbi:hypothetical protein K458DRAFT_424729 [Lentithecium fluviatile CBS 122367]|uniref:Ubiquitin 3 binding protein But2 C-terminal domain-containing protein n=1 Tax=Lentithecium fluviatile CBS 122367 TaxID=1168545 RepID=A0A6G1IEL7_9PLEO|nr:hypothetical protein K458DRAFT_424729 [Lentithecium fluviatile CBS 122367]
MKVTALTLISLLGLTTAAPIEEKRWPSDPTIIKPTYISNYNINTGGLTYNPAVGKAKFDKTSTISTFTIPSTLSGRKCSLNFHISPSDTAATLSAATGVQVFSTNQVPPTYNVASWGPPGNQRNQHYGNLKLQKPGNGVVDDWPQTLKEFPCPVGTYAWEVVAKWDVAVEYGSGVSGLYIKPL